MHYSFSYGIREIGFELRSVARTTLKIEVLPDTRVIVTAPDSMSLETVFAHVKRSGGVIYKRLTCAEDALKANSDILEGKCILFGGEKYPLMKIDEGKKRARLDFNGKFFTAYNVFGDKLRKVVANFYLEEGKTCIPPKVRHFQQLMGVDVSNIWVKTQHKRWGSYQAGGSVYFNYAVVAFEESVMDYIIVHELAHFLHKNHSGSFWDTVRRYAPDCKAIEKRLTSDGALISYLYT